MRLLLITPVRQSLFLKKMEKAFYLPRLTMAVIAALTPPDVEVLIVDEHVEKIDYGKDVDIVGITTWTSTAIRAYEIADRFRERGVTVVLGGLHVSALPQEALVHADVLVLGEAENVWGKLIEDFKSGNLRQIYDGNKCRSDLVNLPIPRRELLKSKSLLRFQSVQATRGCPFSCEFCSVTTFFGKTYRLRPIKEVIRDVEETRSKLIFFVDDNIVGNARYAEKLFIELIPLGKKWVGQSTLAIADERLLKLAARSGCLGLLIGLESLHGARLKKLAKETDKEKWYESKIKMIHDHGVGVDASMVFGFDDDDPMIFEKTVDFCIRTKVELVSYHLLTPYPGTRLYERLGEQDRLLHKDWSKYDENHVVFTPAKMSVDCLQNGFYWVWKEFYSLNSILKRARLNMGLKMFFYFAPNICYHLGTRSPDIAGKM